MSDVYDDNQVTSSDGSDTFTETTSQNYFQRLAGSFVAMAFGFVFFFGAIALLAWNESRGVDAIRGLGQAAKETVEASPTPIDPAQNGKLVHLTGDLKVATPLADPELDFAKSGIARLRRKVEMYQWAETKQTSSSSQLGGTETKRTTYSYSKKWAEDPIDSSDFKVQSRHQNPQMPLRTKVTTAKDATIGGRMLTPALLDNLDDFQPATPPAAAPDGFKRSGGALYKGENPDAPAVGDIRVTFAVVPAQLVSVVAQQRDATLAPFRARNGYKIGLVAVGDQAADEMIAEARSKEKMLTWILRVVGFFLFFFALLLIAAPLSALANVIPFVASIVGGGAMLFAFVLAIPLTLTTIAIAWIAVRPLFGVALLLVAALCVYAYRRWVPRRSKPVPMHVGAGAPVPAA